MDKPWFPKMFRHQPPADEPDAQAGTNPADADVQFHTGLMCANGKGVAADYAQAAQWYLKATGQNHALAQFNLGVMYAHGQGVDRDEIEAARWFRRAAQQGDAGGQFNLGMNLYRASIQGAAKDASESRIEAYKWLVLAEAQGYRGSETARATVVHNMTRDDVGEANRRMAAFVPSTLENSPPAN